VSIRVHSWLAFLRHCLERGDRLVDHNPRQFIFEEDRFLRRKRSRIIERRNCNVDGVRVFAVFEKQMGTATPGKRTDSIRVWNLAWFAVRHDQVLARHRTPHDMGRTRAFLAINAMTVDQRNWLSFQNVSCPTANTSTSDLHKMCSLTAN